MGQNIWDLFILPIEAWRLYKGVYEDYLNTLGIKEADAHIIAEQAILDSPFREQYLVEKERFANKIKADKGGTLW